MFNPATLPDASSSLGMKVFFFTLSGVEG